MLASPLVPLLARDRRRTALVVLVGCGLTDVLDGMLARRWEVASATGARLDSAADAVFFPSLGVALWRVIPARDRSRLVAVAAPITALRLATAVVRRCRAQDPEKAHTTLDRAAGAVLATGAAMVLGGAPISVLGPGALLGWAGAVEGFVAAYATVVGVGCDGRPARWLARHQTKKPVMVNPP